MIERWIATVLILAVNLIAIGVAYGKLKARHDSTEEWQKKTDDKLGNGKPGVFVRTETMVPVVERVEDHEVRLRAVEAK